MAAIILVLLFSAGVLAQQPPPLALTFRQDTSDIAFRTPSALAKQIAVDAHQDDSDFASGNDSVGGTKQMTVKSEVLSTNEDTDSGCTFPFVRVGNSCYHFSSEQKSFADAESYCETLGHGHTYESTLAMMGYDRYEDQALLDAVNNRSTTFWIGGNTEDGVNWSWLDDRPISLQAPFWYYGEPNSQQNMCIIAEVTSSGNHQRSYLHDYLCTDSLNFICQAIFPFNYEFRLIGEDYYFLSVEIGLPYAHWQEARDFCRSLYVPLGYHADLAVLSMPQQDDYDLLNKLVSADTYPSAWIGARSETEDCDFAYIDGRQLPVSSTYWRYDYPKCGGYKFVYLNYVSSHKSTYMISGVEGISFPFICQQYKDV